MSHSIVAFSKGYYSISQKYCQREIRSPCTQRIFNLYYIPHFLEFPPRRGWWTACISYTHFPRRIVSQREMVFCNISCIINVAEVIAMIDLNIYEAMVVRVREAIGKTVIRIGKHCLKLVGEAGNAVICIASRRIDLPGVVDTPLQNLPRCSHTQGTPDSWGPRDCNNNIQNH